MAYHGVAWRRVASYNSKILNALKTKGRCKYTSILMFGIVCVCVWCIVWYSVRLGVVYLLVQCVFVRVLVQCVFLCDVLLDFVCVFVWFIVWYCVCLCVVYVSVHCMFVCIWVWCMF